MQIYETPEEGNHRYQRQLATALTDGLTDGLGLDAGLKAAQSNGWEGVLDVLLGKRPGTFRRSTDLDNGTRVRTRNPFERNLDGKEPVSCRITLPVHPGEVGDVAKGRAVLRP